MSACAARDASLRREVRLTLRATAPRQPSDHDLAGRLHRPTDPTIYEHLLEDSSRVTRNAWTALDGILIIWTPRSRLAQLKLRSKRQCRPTTYNGAQGNPRRINT